MDTRTRAYDGYRQANRVDILPVAVTRWTAQLADPQCERDYRLDRFSEDRRRGLLLMVLAGTAGWLQFFVEVYAHSRGASTSMALLPPLFSIFMPILGFFAIRRLRVPDTLEIAMVVTAAVGVANRLAVVMLHPNLSYMWPTMMVGILLVIYLVFPLRFVTSIVIAAIVSLVMPVWWALSLGSALPLDQFFRGLIWVLFANAVGFIAANSLQRSQRVQYAQSLVLKELLSTDAMTGIGNRRRFDDALDREWRRCSRSGRPLSLLMIDVDHFKAYNDHCGHLQGDDCLRRVARLLVDSVGRPGDLVARYGGEEFVCLLPEIGEVGARAVAAKISAVFAEAAIPHPAFAADGRLTVSIGVATATDVAAQRLPEMVALADKLLYAAKGAGRDQVMAGRL
ncbi:MAG TPA: GGDEF domain-containing protein [Pseudolabrys sp.]|jgi:diguanylate cyclase (GGDEF)-like protein